MNKNDKEFFVQKIRTQYTETETTGIDELKKLHKKVNKPANVFAYIFGTLGAIVMGSGMSLVMTDIGATLGLQETTVLGIVIGVIGMVWAIINYPIYKKILSARRKKYAKDILTLSDNIMKGSAEAQKRLDAVKGDK